MRYASEASPGVMAGVMDYLFIRIIEWAKFYRYRIFDLGMAPFSGLPEKSLTIVWNKLGLTLFRHGENFYNFQGLRHYKDKFDPLWEPRYLALEGGLTLPRTLIDMTALINRGLLGTVNR